MNNSNSKKYLSADCENCFGLCCVALSFAASSDFAFDKGEGTPCRNLQTDYRCGIHKNLRMNGFRGCTVYERFGAGQKVSQVTYNGNDWRKSSVTAKEMFAVFPIMQQLHEMLYYLNEALSLEDARPIYMDLEQAVQETEHLTYLSPKSILALYVPSHRDKVSDLLKKTSELVRTKVKNNKYHKSMRKMIRGRDLIGANLRGANLRGVNLRGALLIASDLREADLRETDLIGADLRDADLRGANLKGSIFLTQVQVNSANGDIHTKLPPSLSIPEHWLV
ncbi:pentapeptide repeat-containing protein [Neobacillus pocheonensis]|uniref:Pentapeptide repeat-containing protein n=1 Tax=Neobacillus pocheonensis TaxID=363869 RepID=A0ABT0WDM6_9BACI|nr:pentapeptide repeat-containing protein [Neobacillus pocheonensis]